MPDVDHGDALVDAAVVDVDDVAAAQGEDRVDALGLQCLRDQVPAGDRLRRNGRVPGGATRDCLGHGGVDSSTSSGFAYCIPYENSYSCRRLLSRGLRRLHTVY